MGVGVAQYRWRGRGLEVATYIVWRGVCMQSACKPRSWAAKCIITRVGEQNQIESQAKLSPMLPCFTSRPEIVILPRFPVLLLYGIRDLALFIYLKILVVVWRALYIHASKCFTTELYYGSFFFFIYLLFLEPSASGCVTAWPWTHRLLPASPSQVLRLRVCMTVPVSFTFSYWVKVSWVPWATFALTL